jgi:hypothetical protein
METALILGLGMIVGVLCGLSLAAQNVRSYRGVSR